MNEVVELYNEFENQFNKNMDFIAISNQLKEQANNGKVIFTLDMHYLLVERVFMNIYMQWEKILEDTFMLYLIGMNDMQGNSYVRYAIPNNVEHAYSMIKGMRNYPDWTNIQEVVTMSKIYFDNMGPYKLLSSLPVEFVEMKTIRNKVSHMSNQADKKFKILVNQKLANNQIDTAGKFLDSTYNRTVTYFQHYSELLFDYVKMICNKEATDGEL